MCTIISKYTIAKVRLIENDYDIEKKMQFSVQDFSFHEGTYAATTFNIRNNLKFVVVQPKSRFEKENFAICMYIRVQHMYIYSVHSSERGEDIFHVRISSHFLLSKYGSTGIVRANYCQNSSKQCTCTRETFS